MFCRSRQRQLIAVSGTRNGTANASRGEDRREQQRPLRVWMWMSHAQQGTSIFSAKSAIDYFSRHRATWQLHTESRPFPPSLSDQDHPERALHPATERYKYFLTGREKERERVRGRGSIITCQLSNRTSETPTSIRRYLPTDHPLTLHQTGYLVGSG